MDRIFFIVSKNKISTLVGLAFVFVGVFVLPAFLLIKHTLYAGAQVTSFYATSCLGGWSNTDKVIGEPNVKDGDASLYTDENSASVFNSIAQIYCGGFKGEIPEDALEKRVVLRFSWALENKEAVLATTTEEIIPPVAPTSSDETLIPVENVIPEDGVPDTSEATVEPTSSSSENQTPEVAPITQEQEVPPAPEPTAPSALESLLETLPVFGMFSTSVAHAQETEVPIEVQTDNTSMETLVTPTSTTTVASTTPEEVVPSFTQPTIPSDAILEVLYTLNGSDWHSLGYVSSVRNDVSFELPADLFTTLADLDRVQIAVRTLATFDMQPKVYLDSMWLDVEYGKKRPDIIPPVVAKETYTQGETIEISGAEVGGSIVVYLLDDSTLFENPDPESRNSFVLSTPVSEDGSVILDASQLPEGRLALVSTLDPEHCSGVYLSQCRKLDTYRGEVIVNIVK